MTALMALSESLNASTMAAVRQHADEYLNTFQDVSRAEWAYLRSILLTNFFADIRTRVSILLREQCQDADTGLFVIPAAGRDYGDEDDDFCGRVTHYDDDGAVKEETGHFEVVEERTQLGGDM